MFIPSWDYFLLLLNMFLFLKDAQIPGIPDSLELFLILMLLDTGKVTEKTQFNDSLTSAWLMKFCHDCDVLQYFTLSDEIQNIIKDSLKKKNAPVITKTITAIKSVKWQILIKIYTYILSVKTQ